ncbi:E3 UFM1-protein ligase 1 homolog [Nilaparvata lugens]|uniref:E3 UFM1-protein ligase 1 homolog n=1 Tax=Nilaparvata lugens TaxID=108931 RepID=UPI00193E29F3|nr:E3 UFM1-protein ligase 1 homolog [Nilaparvata lugens]
MSGNDWEEVKRLAADFQRAQLSATSQRLTERNCIEVVAKLLELKLLDVLFTNDGKEYITPNHLIKEIRDELLVRGGRINLVELAETLNVDLSHVTARATEIERSDAGVNIVLGQLIDKTYTHRVAEEINDHLLAHGQVSIGDLTRQYDLPSEYLQSLVEKNLGKVILAKQDKEDHRLFFTEAFVTRNKCIVRGALTAITQPTTLTAIISQCGLEKKDFLVAFDSLHESKQIAGVLSNRQSNTCLFIPHIYSKAQSEWVNNFYKQNGYLEYDALQRLGISDPVNFVQRNFSSEKLLQLPTCAVGKQLLSQVEASVEEALATGSWLDVMQILPSVFDVTDGEEILKAALKNCGSSSATHTFCNSYLVTDQFLQHLIKPISEELVHKKAEQAVVSGAYQQAQIELRNSKNTSKVDVEEEKFDKRDERRRKAAVGKGGGGTQGRETKTKSAKKKHQKNRVEESDSEDEVAAKKQEANRLLQIISIEEIKPILLREQSFQDEELEDFVSEIAAHILPIVNKSAIAEAQQIFESRVVSDTQSRRKVHSELQEKINALMNDIRLYEKGLKQFPVKDTQAQLTKYLLKTIGTDIVNGIFSFVAQENCTQHDNVKELTVEMRQKISSEIGKELRDPLTKLNKTLVGNSLEEFMTALESVLSGVDLVIRKPDKKKDRPQMLAHKQVLLQQMMGSDDPALALHLATLVIFQVATQSMLHASGRFVSTILQFLRSHLPEDDYQVLQKFHDMVLKLLTLKDEDNQIEEIKKTLEENMTAVKNIANNYKKSASKDDKAS